MKKKLKLSELNVQSFVTDIDGTTIKGGTGLLETNDQVGSCAPYTNLTRCHCFYPTVGQIHCELQITGPLVGC
jgi:hypothetical protein